MKTRAVLTKARRPKKRRNSTRVVPDLRTNVSRIEKFQELLARRTLLSEGEVYR
jgi:hypothetical protein